MVRPKKPLFAGPFSIYSGCSSATQSGFCSKCSTWNIVFAELRACEMFHVEHFGVCSPLPWGGFCLDCALSPGGGLGKEFESKLPFPFTGRRWGKGSFLRGGAVLGQLCVGRRGGTGNLGAGWTRLCSPQHAAFRTRCTPTVQRVRSEAHYAAAVPRLARLAPGGGQGKIGQSAALPCWPFDSGQGNTTRRKRSPVLPT